MSSTAAPKKQVKHFMLHVDPIDCPDRGMVRLGRYRGADARAAALKAASKLRVRDDLPGMDHLVVRQMNTKCCSRFAWSIRELDKPRVVAKKDKDGNSRGISYQYAPRVKLVERFIMDSDPVGDDADE